MQWRIFRAPLHAPTVVKASTIAILASAGFDSFPCKRIKVRTPQGSRTCATRIAQMESAAYTNGESCISMSPEQQLQSKSKVLCVLELHSKSVTMPASIIVPFVSVPLCCDGLLSYFCASYACQETVAR